MALTPEYNALEKDFTALEYVSNTYFIDFEKGVINGTEITDNEALKQSIYMTLKTEAGKFVIYPDAYGVEDGLYIGKPRSFARARLELAINEALLRDNRIASINDFTAENVGADGVRVEFTVITVDGDSIEIEKEVTLN